MSAFDAYVGYADETTFGEAVVPTDFTEFTSESVTGNYERIESEAIRTGARTLRADRFVPNPKGAAGDLSLEVLNQGLAFWLKHMLGDVAVTGTAPTVTHTATPGDLDGRSFGLQIGRAGNGGVVPFDYAGGKVASWELSNSTDGLLILTLTMDFASESIGGAASTPTFPVDGILLSYLGGSIDIGGVPIEATEVSLTGENGIKTDRYSIGRTGKREQRENEMRAFGASFTAEFEDDTHAQRVAALTASGTLASGTFEWATPDGTHKVTVEMPNLRFDQAPVNHDSAGIPDQQVTCKAVEADGASPITLTVITPDA